MKTQIRMLQILLLMLFLIKSSAQSETDKLDEFFKNKRNEVLEKGILQMGNLNNLIAHGNKKQYIQYKPQKYEMNIQDSVETRWGPLCDKYTANYTIIYNYLDNVLESTGAAKIVYGLAMEWFITHVTDPYKSEMEYFS
eukprot:201937_1